jgi:hypothetical protein
MSDTNTNIQEAKRRLPLPKLMAELGCGDHAKKTARCPFHQPENNPSFSVFETKDGQWGWKCRASCGSGDQIDFLAKAKGIDVKEATKLFLERVGVGPATAPAPVKSATPETPKAVVIPRPLGELLNAVAAMLRRYVAFPLPEQALVVALWVVHTWAIEAFDFTLYFHALQARSG